MSGGTRSRSRIPRNSPIRAPPESGMTIVYEDTRPHASVICVVHATTWSTENGKGALQNIDDSSNHAVSSYYAHDDNVPVNSLGKSRGWHETRKLLLRLGDDDAEVLIIRHPMITHLYGLGVGSEFKGYTKSKARRSMCWLGQGHAGP